MTDTMVRRRVTYSWWEWPWRRSRTPGKVGRNTEQREWRQDSWLCGLRRCCSVTNIYIAPLYPVDLYNQRYFMSHSVLGPQRHDGYEVDEVVVQSTRFYYLKGANERDCFIGPWPSYVLYPTTARPIWFSMLTTTDASHAVNAESKVIKVLTVLQYVRYNRWIAFLLQYKLSSTEFNVNNSSYEKNSYSPSISLKYPVVITERSP